MPLTDHSSKHFLMSKSGGALNSGLLTVHASDHEALATLGPNYATLDNHLYAINTLVSVNPTAGFALDLDNLTLELTLPYILSVRQVLVTLALLTCSRE